ncbi:MBL fold metallo-hydrolase [Siminovitchia sediminis]|uniref:MBL fold metallo-hydrolase n=1 Tax=Siminovitchia sediminis TaxID=1274353 RepID=A0ABW4KFB8_9BACI
MVKIVSRNAIILAHGHLDHVGVEDLVQRWGVKVFAHQPELPYLTGTQSYPEPNRGRLKESWLQKNVTHVASLVSVTYLSRK